MNPLSPFTVTSGESPRPFLSLVSDGSSTRAKKSESEIIEDAFGGERKLWRLRGPWWPGVSRFQVALERLSVPVPHGLTPTECLEAWGLERNDSTDGLFYLAENYDRLFDGRILVNSLAVKWIMSVFGSGNRTSAAGEELTKEDHTGEFQGVSLRYISVEEELPGNMCINNVQEFSRSIVLLIEEYLLSRPVPKGHRRFFHGTSTSSMNSIVDDRKIDQSCFHGVGDFGPAFYCADAVRTAFRFAMLTALDSFMVVESGRQSASVIYFDVPEADLNKLNQLELVGEAWSKFTGQCLQKQRKAAYSGRTALELVMGKLVRNPHEVGNVTETSQSFDDNRMQYAFREVAGNLLLQDPSKMGVVLFDVYMPKIEKEEKEE